MKGNRLLTITLAVVVLVGFTYLMSDYARQQKRQAAFTDQIVDLERALAFLPAPVPDLEQQLADISAYSATVSRALSDKALNSTSLIESLLSLADQCDMKVTPLTAQAWTAKKVGESEYKILPMDLQVQGSLTNLIDFVRKICDPSIYPNLLITALQITGNPTGADAINVDIDSIAADLSLTIVRRLPAVSEESN